MVVEDPEIHKLGRSSSSLCDQMQYIECRRECLLGLAEGLVTKAGILVHNLMPFFHGDGPAMQFEAGNKIGGHYCCVGCEAHSSRFDHLAYCFHARHLTLSERQDFILQGEAWKRTVINPLDNLKVAKLRTELEKHGYSTMGKKMAQLEKEFDDLRKGISNVQQTPQATLESLNLEKYEVFATEPLHDLKGHVRNIIEESVKKADGETKTKCTSHSPKQSHSAVLRLSQSFGYHLKQCNNKDIEILELFRTATEICETMYAPDFRCTSKVILRLHNLTYQHGKMCVGLFTKSSNTTTMYGRYFHSIICHAPLLFRIVCLRSVNTEVQERMFGQAKQITRGTSSLKASHIITNIMTRLQVETKARENPLTIQEGEIHKLSKTLGPTLNSVIPYSWIKQNSSLHQTHLERISDFLLPGVEALYRWD